MNSLLKNFIINMALFLGISSGLYSQDIPAPPNPPRLVNDFTGILSPDQIQSLENKLVRFNDSTSTQIVVVMVNSLNGYEKQDFAYRLGESWGIGQKGKNNGIVILVKPKTESEGGEAFIKPAYGLEGVVPDAICKRIVDNEMIPLFRENRYYEGIDAATNTLMSITKGEFTADQYAKKQAKKPYGLLLPILILAGVFFLIRLSKARTYSVGKSLPFWTAFWLLGNMGRGHHSGSWSDFSSGSGSFGGGGFGGFGGGSFGGGGAGGSW